MFQARLSQRNHCRFEQRNQLQKIYVALCRQCRSHRRDEFMAEQYIDTQIERTETELRKNVLPRPLPQSVSQYTHTGGKR